MPKAKFEKGRFPTGMNIGKTRKLHNPKTMRGAGMPTHKSTRLGALDEGVGKARRFKPKGK